MRQICRKFKFEYNCQSGPNPAKYNVEHQCWLNAHTMLPDYYPNVAPPMMGSDITPAFTQHCLNVVTCRSPMLGRDITTTFTQCFLNVVLMSFPSTTLLQHLLTLVNTMTTLGFGSKHNVGTMFTQCCLDGLPTVLWCLKVYTNERADRRWGKVGTNDMTTLPRCWSVSWLSISRWCRQKPKSTYYSKRWCMSFKRGHEYGRLDYITISFFNVHSEGAKYYVKCLRLMWNVKQEIRHKENTFSVSHILRWMYGTSTKKINPYTEWIVWVNVGCLLAVLYQRRAIVILQIDIRHS